MPKASRLRGGSLPDHGDQLVQLGPFDDPGDRSSWRVEDQVAAQFALAPVSGDQRSNSGAVHELCLAEIDENHSAWIGQGGQHLAQSRSRVAVELSITATVARSSAQWPSHRTESEVPWPSPGAGRPEHLARFVSGPRWTERYPTRYAYHLPHPPCKKASTHALVPRWGRRSFTWRARAVCLAWHQWTREGATHGPLPHAVDDRSGGAARLHDNPDRLKQVNAEVESMAAWVCQQWALLGPYDSATILEAADEKAIARVALRLEARGTIRSLPYCHSDRRLSELPAGVSCPPAAVSPASMGGVAGELVRVAERTRGRCPIGPSASGPGPSRTRDHCPAGMSTTVRLPLGERSAASRAGADR